MVTALLPSSLLVFLFLAGAPVGMPLSLPPLPEDPVLVKIAPVHCVWYVAWAGVDKADPASQNKVEQLLAEDDVGRFLHDLNNNLKASFAKATAATNDPLGKVLGREGPNLFETLLTRPTVAYVSDVSVGPHGPMIRAGVALNLGDNTESTKAALEKIEQAIPQPGPTKSSVPATGAVESGRRDFTPAAPTTGADAAAKPAGGWHTLPTPPDAPPVQWGIKEKYLVVGIGEGEAELLWARTGKSAPDWLAEIRSRLKVDRPSLVQYVNVQTLTSLAQTALAATQGAEHTQEWIETLGIKNVKYYASVSGLDQDSYISRTLLAIDGPPSGLLGLIGGEPLDAAALKPIPADASFAVAARVDANKALEALLSVVALIKPSGREQIESGLQQLSQMTGVDIKSDLIGSLGDSWCVYNSPGDGGLVLTGLTITATIRDRDKLQQANDKLVAFSKQINEQMQRIRMSNGQRFGGSMLAETEFRGQTIYFINFIGEASPFAPAWCITDKQVVFSLFPQTIKAYLQRQNAAGKNSGSAGSGQPSLSSVPEVAQHFAAGSSPTLVSYQDTANQFKLFYPLLQIFAQVACSQLQQQGVDVNISMLPNARAIVPHLTPAVSTIQTTKEGIWMESHGTLPTGGVGTLPLLAVPMLLPATAAAREAAMRNQSANNLKQIALAMLNFQAAKKTFPPAFSADKDGKPLLSWRVMILPFVEEQALFQQFKLDEPWDSENNKKLIEKMPDIYKAPGSKAAAEFKTVYLTVRGDDTAFPGAKGIRLRDISDGTSRTIMAVEAADDKAIVWTKPDDFDFDDKGTIDGQFTVCDGVFLTVFCDGAVHSIPQSIDIDTLKALFVRNSGKEKNVP